MAFFGLDTALADTEDFAVDPANWEIVQMFIRCATQWQYAGMTGVRTGLHYPGVEVLLRLLAPTADPAALFAGIQVMEQAALQAWHEDAARKRQHSPQPKPKKGRSCS